MQVTIRDAGDLKRINKQLRQVADGKQLRKELTGGMHKAVRPVVPQVKAAYLASPSKGHATSSRARRAQPSLRSLLAKATRAEVRLTGRQAGVRVRVDGRKMPPGMKALPRYWEGSKRPWRHPVFGFRGGLAVINRWVTQPARPTFDRVVEPYAVPVRAEVDRVFERVKRKLEAGR